ncbi:fimbrial protein [Carnimonas bestiolae]|uniref:fimbrial protein n=1 Tax=Carnimonas bestiolae TaxID=3402172 RepID=UPI003EDC9DA3
MNKFVAVARWWLMLMVSLWSASGWAMQCYEGGYGGNTRHTTMIDREIVVPVNVAPGTELWRSPEYSATLTCYDTEERGDPEDAFMYWDPRGELKTLPNSIEVVVHAQGMDYDPLTRREDWVARGTRRPTSTSYCIGPTQEESFLLVFKREKRCAKPQTFTLTYSISINATGNPPPPSGRLPSSGTYDVFQIDGPLGINMEPNANFSEFLGGLNNIRFTTCNPRVYVEANRGNTVDFGRLAIPRDPQVGQVEKVVGFTVNTSLESEETGRQCAGKALVASFSSGNPVIDESVIMPTSDSGFGIVITPGDSATPILMNQPVTLGTIDGSTMRTPFRAGLKWLSDKPRPGRFNATATIDVTYQ